MKAPDTGVFSGRSIWLLANTLVSVLIHDDSSATKLATALCVSNKAISLAKEVPFKDQMKKNRERSDFFIAVLSWDLRLCIRFVVECHGLSTSWGEEKAMKVMRFVS
jgi:hypothetical protein